MKNSFTVIFDMDGVIVDSNPFHKEAWKLFLKKYDFNLSEDDFKKKIFGKTNRDILEIFFGNKLTRKKVEAYTYEKELFYQKSFEPYICLTNGLEPFLETLKFNNIKIGISTSAPVMNIDFVMEKTGIRDYFSVIVDESQINKGKPDPEIYLKTASRLSVKPSECIVFEDSISGVRSARNAGMKVIGITTTHLDEELSGLVDFVINDFSGLSLEKLKSITLKDTIV